VSVPFSVDDVLAWTQGSLVHGADATFDGVSIDTRTLAVGQLFVAIAGERFDAHDFLEGAVGAGAGGLLVQTDRVPKGDLPASLPVISVGDTTRALGALASGHRSRFEGPVVAVTGSNGKTTTKEMCAAILGADASCLKNAGNLNNEFGLPLTLLRRESVHERIVVELGMNHRGEIARLAAIARPTVGVITNVGTAHIEYLGSQDAIAEEKGDLVASLSADAVAVLNADDPRVRAQAARTRARLLLFGFSEDADVRARDVRPEDGGFVFGLETPAGAVDARVAGLGRTAILNALAAAAAALGAGLAPDAIARGLATYLPVSGRLEPVPCGGGGLVINDTYNANPQSMEVALRILAERRGSAARHRRGIAVLGDMGELGEESDRAHENAGRLAATLGIDELYAVGRYAGIVAEGARDAGMDPAHVHTALDWQETGERVCADRRDDDQILVKGSRAMRMERIVELLTRQNDAATGSEA
jgi:UDP-N-acetylmuramoyl-tripeptide--D-alanyl-D-alanine ligase